MPDEVSTDSPSDARGPKTAEDIVRLLAERQLPGWLGGPLVWAWTLSTPLLFVGTLIALASALGSGGWMPFWALLLATMTGRALTRLSIFARDARAALLLPELDGRRIGALTDALFYPEIPVRNIARLRLTTVLPSLTEAEAAAVQPAHRALLYQFLNPWTAHTEPDFVCAILPFATLAADELALAGTEQLAEMRAFTASQRRVRLIARRCLPRLEAAVSRKPGFHLQEARQAQPRESQDSDAPLSPEAQAWLKEVEGDSSGGPGMRFGFLLASWLVIVPYGLWQTVHQWRDGRPAAAFLAMLLALAASQLYRFTLTPRQARLASRLGAVDSVEAIGPIAEMTSWPDERIRSIAIAALCRLLPRMKASDTRLLSPRQRSLLYPYLSLSHTRRYGELQIALLAALEQIGDVDALPLVRALAAEDPKNMRQTRVVMAASACLPYLENCAGNNRDSQVLLRAVTEEAEAAALLRPAGREAETPPERLLRTACATDPDSAQAAAPQFKVSG